MANILNNHSSTTRLLVKDKPVLKVNEKDAFESILFLPPNRARLGEGGLRTKGYFKKSYSNKPLITIITVVYNREKTLEKTIRSIIEQTYDNIEYIIIDGGSTDHTLDIIKKYDNQIDYWVSEKDSGISDAFNKGIYLSTGEYINLLNSDDFFINRNIIANYHCYFKQHHPIITSFAKFKKSTIPHKALSNNNSTYTKSMISHQASFIHINVYKNIGLYSKSLMIRQDYEFFLRALSKYKFVFIPKIILFQGEGGIGANNLIKHYFLGSKVTLSHFLNLINKFSIILRGDINAQYRNE